MLVRLLYASRVVDTSAGTLDAIVERATEHNKRNGITGILCCSSRVYMQVLEGERTIINALYGKLMGDPRHKDLTLLAYEEIEERSFGKWTMGRVHMSQANQETLLRFSTNSELNPFVLSGKVAYTLTNELVASA
jgi:hypothetical protein